MSVTVELDAPRPPQGEGFSDAVTFAFGDPGAELYAIARLGLAGERASGLAIVFHRGQPVAVSAQGDVAPADAGTWDGVRAAGLDSETVQPLRVWNLALAHDDVSIDVAFEALGPIGELDPDDPVARAGGMAGYEQPCRVGGQASVGGVHMAIEGLGQRGRSWGSPDWERLAVARTLSAWLDEDLAVSLSAVRPATAGDHGAELVSAVVLEREEETGEPRATAVLDARLSTTADAEGRQRNAGLELWVDEDGDARRVAGHVLCGTTLDLGRLRLDCSFFSWQMEGRTGFGRYDVLRRSP